MAETTVTRRFELRFNTVMGKTVRFTIPRADVGKSAPRLQTSMDALVANGGIRVGEHGTLNSTDSVQLITTTTTPIPQ